MKILTQLRGDMQNVVPNQMNMMPNEEVEIVDGGMANMMHAEVDSINLRSAAGMQEQINSLPPGMNPQVSQ